MAKKSKSPFAILGMLGVLKKSTGYDLKKHMESSTQYFWKETFSSIYPVLEDLEKQKLIVKVEKAASKTDRKSNAFMLTPEGRSRLKHWLRQPVEDIQLRNELVLKLFFGAMVPIEVSLHHLEEHKNELKKKLVTYQEIKTELSDFDSLESVYWLITLDHGIKQVLTSLEWCDDAIRTLRKQAGKK